MVVSIELTDKIDYTKKPLTLAEQVARLKQRGLVFDDESEATAYLFNISYYRLRAYTYPFQENGEDSEHTFTRKDIHFKDIIDLYCFDRRLRSLIFNTIEKIEVAVRTKIVQVYAESTGDSHWFNDESLYRFGYDDLMDRIDADVNRSNEDFIKHYNSKYDNPSMPPSWMALEVVSFATLSRLFQSLRLDSRKEYITEQFGLKLTVQESKSLRFKMRFSLTAAIWNGKKSTSPQTTGYSRCTIPSVVLKNARFVGSILEIVLQGWQRAILNTTGNNMVDFL